MGFIKLNRYGDASGCVFDVDAVVHNARSTFANVKVVPGDQLALSAERAAAAGAADLVVQTLRRNQQNLGPAYIFEFSDDGNETIQGRARRYDVTFLYAHPLTELSRQRLLAFLKSLGPGRIEESAGNITQPAGSAAAGEPS